MKKLIIGGLLVATMLAGGAVTAMASSDEHSQFENVPPSAPQGLYDALNKLIIKNWNNLSQENRNYYVSHPDKAPTALFPFGIDTDNCAPKGFPTCEESEYPATYAPTAPLSWQCNTDSD
jgi:hypothetical protein